MAVFRVNAFRRFPVSARNGQRVSCIRDGTGVSGLGYKKERSYVVHQGVLISVEEQVLGNCECACSCLPSE